MAKQKTISEIAAELFELLKAYASQETIGPIKTLGGYLGWGAGGSLLMSLGLFFLGLEPAAGPADRDERRVRRRLVVGALLHRRRSC